MMSIPTAAAHFLGWRYANTREGEKNRLPVVRDCLPSSLLLKPGQDRLVDCSTFWTAVMVYRHAWVDWDAEAYPDMQIFDAARPWSPVDAWVRHGLGNDLNLGENAHGRRAVLEPAQGWGAYQGWVDPDLPEVDGDGVSGGHQWGYHGGMGVRLHSTSRGSRGPTREHADWGDLLAYYKGGIRGVELRAG